jgi:hypothetical protein
VMGIPRIGVHCASAGAYVSDLPWRKQIGKRNPRLKKASIQTTRRIQKEDSKAPRWIAADALRELTSRAVQDRLGKTERTMKKD